MINYPAKTSSFWTLVVLLTVQLSYALQGGPIQPDYMQFEPSATKDLVNLQTGNFTYSIPLGELPGPYGGYPLSMSYHAGVSPQQEATWVGLGWTLSPGSINREVRGVPDDQFHGGTLGYVYQYSSMQTWSLQSSFSMGTFSIGQTTSNTGGTGYSVSVGANIASILDVGFTVSKDAIGMNASVGFGNTGNLNASLMLSANGSTSAGVGAKFASKDVNASVGAQYATGSGAAYDVQFGDGHGRAKVGMTASPTGMRTSVGYGSISTEYSRNGSSVSVKGATLSVSNASTKGHTKTSSVGMNIVVPIDPTTYFSIGFNQSLSEYRMQSATSDYVYGYLYQAGPSIVADGKNSIFGLPDASATNGSSSGSSSWKWTMKGRTLEGLGDRELHPAYDMYTVASEGISGTFRPFAREEHRLHRIVSNAKTSDKEVFEEYSALLKDSADGWPYTDEFEKTQDDSSSVPRADVDYYKSYEQCIHSDSCSPYALYATRFINEGNRLVFRRNKDVDDTLTTGMKFLFVGEGGYYESEPYEGAKLRGRRDVYNELLKRRVGQYDYALYGSRKIEPIFEDDSPVGKLKGFVVTNSDGTRYYFEKSIKSYLKVDYSINQEKGTPVFIDRHGDASDGLWKNIQSALWNYFKNEIELYIPIVSLKKAVDYLFKKGTLDEKCHTEENDENNSIFYTYQVNMNPYATQWLLTEIRGPDYIRLGDSISDNVGYNVKFHYTEPSVYRWRTPFARPGLDMTDLPNFRIPRNGYTPEGCDSRMYQASFGVKEYVYLESIETSTHRVVFELNDPVSEERVDGKGWDLNYEDKSSMLPLMVQASIAFGTELVSATGTTLYGVPQPKYFDKQKIVLVPQYLYTNTLLPDILLKKLRNGKKLKIGGLPSTSNPTLAKDVVDTMLYNMTEDNYFEIDSGNTPFSITSGEESKFGLYKIRLRQTGDSIIAYRYLQNGKDTNLYNGKTVVFGEKGNYRANTLINWSELVFASDSADHAENQMRYLKKISYFKKNDSVPYSEYSFAYDYTLHPKTINSYCYGHYPEDNDQIKNSPDSVALGACNTQGIGNFLYGKLTLKSVTEKGCQYGRCSSLPPFKFEYNSPSLTSTRLSTKQEWKNLSQNIVYDSPEDSSGTNQFPESYYDSLSDLDASLIASSNAVDDWGFWNERANEENHKVWQDFADFGASAWSLSRITEPAGGVLDIEYERDVYKAGEDNSNENMYVNFESVDACEKYEEDYPVDEADSSKICIELERLYWREQCLGPRAAFWDRVRPAGYQGSGFEYLEAMGIIKNETVDTSQTLFYNVLGNMGTSVKCGGFGLGRCSRTRSVAVLGDGKPLKLISANNDSTRLLVLDRLMPYMDAALNSAADKINSSKRWNVKSRQGALWVKTDYANMKGGDLRVKRLVRHDMGRTVATEYEYAPGEMAQLPDSAYNTVTGNRFYSGKVSFALPDMDLSPKSRIVGFSDDDLQYLPGSSVTYPKVTVRNSGLTESNGKTVFEYITPETGIPARFIDEDTKTLLTPFIHVNSRLFVWGGYENDKTYKERPFLVTFTLLDSNRNILGSPRKIMVLREGTTSFNFYSENIRNARYLTATSRYTMDQSHSEQFDTLALSTPLTDFNDMDISIVWFLGDYELNTNYRGWMKDEIKDNQTFVLHQSWSRSQAEGFYPILYKKVEYGKDSITLQEMDAQSGANEDQRDDADFDSSIVYHDFTAFLGLNTGIAFYRGDDNSAIIVRMDSNNYSTKVPNVVPGIAENTEIETQNKLGIQKERWSYERILKCKSENKDENCEKQYIELYDKDSRKDARHFSYIRYPAYQIGSVTYTGHDNQPSTHGNLWGKSILENYLYDPATGLPTATLAKTPASNGKEMRKLTKKFAHYVIRGDSLLADSMFHRNMLVQEFLNVLYSGTVAASSAWNSIAVNDSMRSFSLMPFRLLADSLYSGKRQPIVAWGNFKSRKEPKDILGDSTILAVLSRYQNADSLLNHDSSVIALFEGAKIDLVDRHFRVRESHDDFRRVTSSHYSYDGAFQTGLFFPAGLADIASIVPHGDSISMTNCGINSVGYNVTDNALVSFGGITYIQCGNTADTGKTYIAEYAMRKSGRPWEVVRDTARSMPFELTLYGGYLLSYLRVYPIDGVAKTFIYDRYGNLKRSVSEENISTYYEYDPFGHLVQIRDDDGNSFKAHHREYRNDDRDSILLGIGGTP